MHLYDFPILAVVMGLILYSILGGADFGAGLWQLTALPPLSAPDSASAKRIRDHTHHSIGPVWEANHVWLIFVLTVTWTAFPSAFGAIASTLGIALSVVGIGIIFRGAAYAFRITQLSDTELSIVDTVFSLSSILAPFGLGAAIGAIAGGRIPVGNASGHLLTSWLNPVSIDVGLLAVSVSAYTAAVYLAADAQRSEDAWMAGQFRTRALIAGAVSGVIALAGIPLMHSGAHRVFERLIDGPGLAGLIISVLGGVATMTLVTQRRFALARLSAALAVAGIIIGWALAQQPLLLPHLTLAQAAAPGATQIVVIVAIAAGATILFPSLWLLFRLLLQGRFDALQSAQEPAVLMRAGLLSASAQGLLGRAALACLIAGIGLLNGANASWAHIIGAVSLLTCIVLGVLAVAPTQLAAESGPGTTARPGADT